MDKGNREVRNPMVGMLNDHLARVRAMLDQHLEGQAEAMAALCMVLQQCTPSGALEKGLRAQINAAPDGCGETYEVRTRLLRAMPRAIGDPRHPLDD